MGAPISNETLELFKKAQQNPIQDALFKAWQQSGTATSGITYYDLEAPAKLLFPVLTPLRNRIPRVVGGLGIQANWRAITGINTGRVPVGLVEGRRNAAISHTTADYLAAFKGIGLDDFVTFESDYAAQGFDDVKARATDALLRSTMIGEELVDLGGNSSTGLGTTPTPTLATSTTGGALPATTTYYVNCVALTLAGWEQVAGVANGVVNDSLLASLNGFAFQRTISRANMDGTTDTIQGGCAQVSAQANIATGAGATNSITATVTPVRGAVAYAWFWGTTGSVLLGAVTTINSVSITTTATGTENVTDFTTSPADNSADSTVYDGMLAQIMKSGSGSYFVDLATGTPGTGSKLTSDGAGGIAEVNAAFQSFYNNYRMSPDEIYMNSQQVLDVNAIIIKNGGAPLIRFNMDNGGNSLVAGISIGSILNRITNTLVKVTVHPNIPPGTMMFWSDSVPFPLSGVQNIVQKKLRRDYYQVEWPLRTRRYEYGVYFDGVLQNYFPPAFGIIRNIAAGN